MACTRPATFVVFIPADPAVAVALPGPMNWLPTMHGPPRVIVSPIPVGLEMTIRLPTIGPPEVVKAKPGDVPVAPVSNMSQLNITPPPGVTVMPPVFELVITHRAAMNEPVPSTIYVLADPVMLSQSNMLYPALKVKFLENVSVNRGIPVVEMAPLPFARLKFVLASDQ